MRLPAPRTTLAGVSALTMALALGACGSTTKAAAPAAQTAASAPGVSQFKSSESPKSISDYWTPERLAAVKPKPLPESAEKAGKQNFAAQSGGPELSVDPILPTLGGANGATFNADAKSKGQGDQAWVWQKHGTAPARTIGLLVFMGADGKTYSCSATVITAKNRSLLWTAGHCAYERGADRWAQFMPDYHDGKKPLGTWPVSNMWVPNEWVRHMNPNFDIAAMQVFPAGNGHRIQDYTGSQGFTFNYKGRTFPVLDFGYPGDLLPSGQRVDFNKLRYCTGTSYGINLGWPGPAELSLHCTLGHGASGGPWLTNVGRSGFGRLIGTNSTHSLSHDDMHAAYEGSVAVQLYNAAAG